MSLNDRHHLVSHMIHQRIGTITQLTDAGHVDVGKRVHDIGLADDAEARAHEIDMELRPQRGAHGCVDRNSPSVGSIRVRTCQSQFEGEPVTEVKLSRSCNVALGHLTSHRTIDVDVNGGSDANASRQQRGRSFDDPPVVDDVESSQEAVVSHLALKLGKTPPSLSCEFVELVGERSTERHRTCVAALALAHLSAPDLGTGGGHAVSTPSSIESRAS